MKSKFSIEDKLAFFIFAVGAILRFYNFSGWSLSNDELSAMARLRFDSLSEMLEKGVKLNDMHPAGVQTFLYYWTHLFGIDVVYFRLPFVIMGCFSVWIIYLIAARWFNKTAALFTMLMFAGLQFPILYSQLARPYSPGLLFSLLTVYAWTRILFPIEAEVPEFKKQIKWYALFILSAVVCMYSHYFAFMFVGIVGLSGFFFIRRSQIPVYLLSGVVMFLLYLPNLPIFLYQFGIGGLGGPEGWLGPPEKDAVWQYLKYGLNESTLILLVCCIVFVAGIIRNGKEIGFTRFHKLALSFFLIPALIAYYYSIFRNPVFQYSILIFSFPYLLIFIFSFVPTGEWKLRTSLQFSVLLLIVLYSTVMEKKYYSTQHFAVFKDVAEKVAIYDQKYGAANLEKTVNVINEFYINYYMERNPLPIKFSQYLCNSPERFAELDKIAAQAVKTKPYFLHAWANNYHASEVDQILRQYYPYVVEVDSFFNSGVVVYGKNKPAIPVADARKVLHVIENGFELPIWKGDSLLTLTGDAHTGNNASKLDSVIEYGSTFEGYNLVKKGNTVEISLWVKTATVLQKDEASIVLVVDQAGTTKVWRSINFSEYVDQANVWQKVFLAYSIPDDIGTENKLLVYPWNPGKANVLIDDVKIVICR